MLDRFRSMAFLVFLVCKFFSDGQGFALAVTGVRGGAPMEVLWTQLLLVLLVPAQVRPVI